MNIYISRKGKSDKMRNSCQIFLDANVGRLSGNGVKFCNVTVARFGQSISGGHGKIFHFRCPFTHFVREITPQEAGLSSLLHFFWASKRNEVGVRGQSP